VAFRGRPVDTGADPAATATHENAEAADYSITGLAGRHVRALVSACSAGKLPEHHDSSVPGAPPVKTTTKK